VDWFILAELGLVAVGYWLLAIVAVQRRDRLRDANPAAVAALVGELGVRVVPAALAAAAAALGHGLLAFTALGELREETFVGLPRLAACWASGLFLATCWFRLLGGWCQREPGSR
jgi:hypothetical protein